MKTFREKKIDEAKKLNHKIWKSMKIEEAVNSYGLEQVKKSVTKWLTYQRENAKLLREKRALESKLAEINNKI